MLITNYYLYEKRYNINLYQQNNNTDM